MIRRVDALRPPPSLVGALVGLAGVGFSGIGVWARRDVRRALARERIVKEVTGTPVISARGARSMAELIRRNTVETTAGRTYSEIEPYVDARGAPTFNAEDAARDERTGQPVENPDHGLWIQSTTLQTALMQAYVAFRLTELTLALGASFVAVGIGLTAAGRRASRR